MFPSFRLCGKSKVDIVKIVAFKFQSSKPARVGSADASAHDPPMPVSIIPTREGWVMDESGKWEAKSQFQSSQPVRVGSAQGREQAVNKKVSIIPTREGWV